MVFLTCRFGSDWHFGEDRAELPISIVLRHWVRYGLRPKLATRTCSILYLALRSYSRLPHEPFPSQIYAVSSS
jgi:hypothetical protein